MTDRKVVLSGIRATGGLHIGNYLGAMKHFVDLAADPSHECFFFVANLHTITTRPDPSELQSDLIEIVRAFLTIGLDPEKVVLYAQSSVPEISELTWLLSCLSSTGRLEVMPHWKEKKGTVEIGENAGLLFYPVLMAADILAPKAHIVPVGEDQNPHIEFTRDLARLFNNRYGELFPVPDFIEAPSVRVPSLSGDGKMSKSSPAGAVFLSDEPQAIKEKFRRAVTDTARERRSDPGNPKKCPTFFFHEQLSTPAEIAWATEGCLSAGIGCSECKAVMAKHVISLLEPIQERRLEVDARGLDYILDILADGGQRARARIQPTVDEAKARMGVPRY